MASSDRRLSAGPVELARIAARGLWSLLGRSRSGEVVGAPKMEAETVVSPDTLREVRIPPRQRATSKWPVLHAGPTPHLDPETWDLTISGLVEAPVRWTWSEFRSLPTARVFADMHCVTRWSRLNNTWEGVLVSEVLRHVRLRPGARFVQVRAEHGFTTNLALEDFVGDDCLFAWSHDGVPLDDDHGAPVRLVVPRLYAWKSAKWVRGVEFLDHDRPGFWEQNGYHHRGDPWSEQRFG